MKDVAFTYTFGMDDEAVAERLRTTTAGSLALADDGEAYAVPVAYYYDGEAVFFRLGAHAGSEKLAFVETTTRATLLVYGVDDETDESWSVVVRGPLTRVEAAEAPDAAELNVTYTPMRVFGEDVADLEPVVYRLGPDEVTGRRTEKG